MNEGGRTERERGREGGREGRKEGGKRERDWLTCHSLHCSGSRKRHINSEPQASPRPNLFRTPCSREKCPIVIAMDGQIQNRRVVVEYLLCSVTMVNILHNYSKYTYMYIYIYIVQCMCTYMYMFMFMLMYICNS